MSNRFPQDRRVGLSFRMTYARRIREGFMDKYFSGEKILDIGYLGDDSEALPITEAAIGIALGYPGYDGTHLPFDDGSQDAVLASHVLEHIPNYKEVLAEWYRVLRTGGFLILFVPHRYLLEKRPDLPSLVSGDHRRLYNAASLLQELDESLPINGFRIRHLAENDEFFDYHDPLAVPPKGIGELELVIEKIERPDYSDSLVYSPHLQRMIDHFDLVITEVAKLALAGQPAVELFRTIVGRTKYFTPWHRLREKLLEDCRADLKPIPSDQDMHRLIRPLLDLVDIDVSEYVALNRDLDVSEDACAHWRHLGYFEGRPPRDLGLKIHEIMSG